MLIAETAHYESQKMFPNLQFKEGLAIKAKLFLLLNNGLVLFNYRQSQNKHKYFFVKQ